MFKYIYMLVSILFVAAIIVVSDNETATAAPHVEEKSVELQGDMKLIRGRLEKAFNQQPDAIADSPLKGFFEAVYGTKVFYVSTDAKHLISGEIYDFATLENLTEQSLSGSRLKIVERIPESSMIVYKAKDEKHVINVFTDIDCVYCRKLHQDMAQINALGITVRYLAFPRAGLNSPSYDKAVSVWCAKDRKKAMDNAKASGKIEPLKCDAPVQLHMMLGQQLGISGTPGLILEDGRLQPGYAPPRQLLSLFK
ncbi:MAG: thioredoxin fold domain-containing protein [Pseudomonadota bacterium]